MGSPLRHWTRANSRVKCGSLSTSPISGSSACKELSLRDSLSHRSIELLWGIASGAVACAGAATVAGIAEELCEEEFVWQKSPKELKKKTRKDRITRIRMGIVRLEGIVFPLPF